MNFSQKLAVFSFLGLGLLIAINAFPANSALTIPAGNLVFHNDNHFFIEEFVVPASVSEALRTAEIHQAVTITEFPVEPGVRHPVTLERVEIYASGARIIVIDADGEHDIAHSSRLYFRGTSVWDPKTGIAISVDPTTGRFHGIVRTLDSVNAIAPWGTDTGNSYRLGTPAALQPQGSPDLKYGCGSGTLPPDFSAEENPPTATFPTQYKAVTDEPLYAAVIAFDTDQEWLHYRFADNTTNATTWIADYINESNVMYERDLSLRLMVGGTILRTGGPPFNTDPYSVSESPAGGGMLSEFGTYWDANYDSTPRVFAQLLSGKSSSDSSSSGIAWLDGYCEHQSSGGGYSIFEPFKATWVTMASNVRVGAHELGHNFGSPHTHCYSPVIDECYNQEGGCYDGQTTSCPPGGQGTMMSYCHFKGCGDNQILFHSRVVDLLDGYRAAHTPWCIEELGDPDLIFADGFENGDLSAWAP